MDSETQKRIGLVVAVLDEVLLQPEIVAYGRLVEDPSRSFVLRAPVAGFVRRAKEREWPSVGETLTEPTRIGTLEPRLGAVERTDLESRLALARAEVESSQAARAAARAAFERATRLNAENKTVSDRDLQETEARLKSEEARHKAASDIVRTLESALEPSGAGIPLGVPGGEVVEVPVQPDQIVESGELLLRVTRFDRLLAKVSLPLGENPQAATARIIALGHEDRSLPAQLVARAPRAEEKTPGTTLLFSLNTGRLPLRPGEPVKAFIPTGAGRQKGVIIPRDAVVRFAGRTWAYAQIAEGGFSRREVEGRLVDAGWFVSSGFSPGERIVTAGAQTLLSEEVKAQIQIESDDTEREEKER
ncbi:MAG: HlyD family efflux transporter periplasmic adaptor subunit [Planctomycetes bacterium]|nr:HlyD family efflux transporter periplasmic adaptor subunit [Planctomycetota bacterium]